MSWTVTAIERERWREGDDDVLTRAPRVIGRCRVHATADDGNGRSFDALIVELDGVESAIFFDRDQRTFVGEMILRRG